jgi:hypothetical protein
MLLEPPILERFKTKLIIRCLKMALKALAEKQSRILKINADLILLITILHY